MTDEQIKQNAEEYADGVYDRKLQNAWWQECRQYHIAGAHSRDEEIEELKGAIVAQNAMAQSWLNVYNKCTAEVDQLRNPWISVKKRLPKKKCVVFVSLDGTEYLSAHYRVKSKRFVTVSKDKQTLVEVRKSSATYTVCGDYVKEERLYSKGQREDITSLVTHWMPIPQIKKGDKK